VNEANAAEATSAQSAAVEIDGGGRRPRYRRILLKLSGEALLGSRQYGVDPDFCAFNRGSGRRGPPAWRRDRHRRRRGNIFRGLAAAAKGMDRAPATTSGMLATVIERPGAPGRPREGRRADPGHECDRDERGGLSRYIRRRAVRHLEKGRVIILAAGTGIPTSRRTPRPR